MRDLDRELSQLGVAWPETPDVAAAVSERLAAAPAPRRSALRGWPAWQVAVAATAVLIAVVLAVPPARSAVIEWIDEITSVRLERREPEPSRFGAELSLGRPVTLTEARRAAGFRLGVPAALGEPDAVYLASDPATGTRIDFLYRPRPGLPRAHATGVGLLVTQFRATADPLIEKTLGQASTLERVRVNGAPAFFISGAEHGFAWQGVTNAGFEPGRLAGNTLVVDRADGVLLRLEGELSRDEAIRIAESVR